jgi:hypothetical protein
MTTRTKDSNSGIAARAHAVTNRHVPELQHFGTIARLPIALEASVCAQSVENLNSRKRGPWRGRRPRATTEPTISWSAI